MKKSLRSVSLAALAAGLLTAAAPGTARADHRLSSDEYFAKTFAENASELLFVFKHDLRESGCYPGHGAQRLLLTDLAGLEDRGAALAEAIFDGDCPETIEKNLCATRKALECATNRARQVKLGCRASDLLRETNEAFCGLERHLAAVSRHESDHGHSRTVHREDDHRRGPEGYREFRPSGGPPPRVEYGRPPSLEEEATALLIRTILERVACASR